MEICNQSEFLKRIKKVHLLLPSDIIYSIAEVLNNTSIGITTSENTLTVKVLPENVSVNSRQTTVKEGARWNHKITFDVIPQEESILSILDKLSNKKVVVALESTDYRVFIYGNTDQPLTYTYKEINSKNQEGNIGYQISVSGATTVRPLIRTINEFDGNPFLASVIAGYL
jgi:hypothetical protein